MISNSEANASQTNLNNASVKIPGGEQSEDAYNTFYGPVVQMGNGHARSWINVTQDGKALALGIEMTEGALQNLPYIPEEERDFISGPADFLLPLHLKARELTPYDHITINWNSHGHEPNGIYNVPHFDFHFYKISVAEQLAIPDYDAAPALFDNEPPPGFMPLYYFHGPGGVSRMGAHWADLLSPEFNGQAFTQTFIYGTYNGKVTFHEPMVTMATIQSGVTMHKQLRQPLYVSPTMKYYPQAYSIWKEASKNKYYLSLDNMILK
jgi:hypothetical protein